MRILGKRMMRRLVLFVLLLVAPVLAAWAAGTESHPPAGFYMPQTDPVSTRVAQHLLENGFVFCDDPEQIPVLVQRGELDCGAVFSENFCVEVTKGELDRSIRFYTSPASYTPELYKNHIAAAVFRECAPYISAGAFEGTPVTREEVVAQYQAMQAGGLAFSFAVETLDGAAPVNIRPRSIATAAAAILLLVVSVVLCTRTVERSFKVMLPRLGLKKALLRILLPESLCNTLLAAAFCGSGLWLAGFPELVLPAAVYSVLLCGLSLVLVFALRTGGRVYVLLPMLVLSAVAVVPIFADLSLLLPAMAAVRAVHPVYWLWIIPEAVGAWAAIAGLMFVVGVLTAILSSTVLEKYKF